MEFLRSIDQTLLLWIHQGWRCGFGDVVFVWITNSRNFLVPLGVAYVALLIWGGRRGRAVALALAVALLLTDQLSSQVLKPWIGRVRPCFAVEGVQALLPQSRSSSFPSGHAANTFGAATVLFLAQRRLWSLGFVVALLVGLSRVYVGVHYPSDVLGGAVLGVLCGTVAWKLIRVTRLAEGGRRGVAQVRARVEDPPRGPA